MGLVPAVVGHWFPCPVPLGLRVSGRKPTLMLLPRGCRSRGYAEAPPRLGLGTGGARPNVGLSQSSVPWEGLASGQRGGQQLGSFVRWS